jgi:AcrR family transcriptional regulator
LKRKEAILQAAAAMFSRKGFRDTSMAEVSEITGVAASTIFYHFKNKEELFLAILTDVQETISREFKSFMAQNQFQSGLETVQGIVSFYLHLAGTMEDRFLLLHHYFPYRLSAENEDLRRQIERIYNNFTDIFEKAIITGQKDGSICSGSARKMALIIFALVDGVVRLSTYKLYDGGALYEELLSACRKVLEYRAG